MEKRYVSNEDESIRMFESALLDFFSRVHWSVPLIIFIPVILYSLYYYTIVIKAPVEMMALLIPVGLFFWTITEYSLHRFLFHYHAKSEAGKKFFWTFHGVHHDYPRDSKRLVMVPAVSVPVSAIFYLFFYIIAGEYNAPALFAGFMAGYLFYDMTHYAVHHVNFKSSIWKYLKSYHMKHHYKHPNAAYGVSSPLWDFIFGTRFPDEKK